MEDIRSWQINVDYFGEPVTWSLFSNSTQRLCLIYGRNGTGKTTFSKTVSNFKDDPSGGGPLLEGGNPASQSAEGLFVFNDIFVQNEIGFREDTASLNPIVMFGEAIEVDTKIQELQEKRKKLKEQEASLSQTLQRFITSGDRLCIEDSMQNCANAIRLSWAQRDKEIRGGAVAGKVSESVVARFLDERAAQSHTIAEQNHAKKQYPSALEKYKKVRDYSTLLPIIPAIECEFSNASIAALLGTVINRPISNELVEKVLLEMRENRLDLESFEASRRRIIINTNSSTCPLCFQNITQEYKDRLASAFDAVISREAADHKQALESLRFQETRIDTSLYTGKIDDNELSGLKEDCDAWNSALTEASKWVKTKINDPYTPLSPGSQINIDASLKRINDRIACINLLLTEFNKDVQTSKQLKKELDEYNNLITLLDNAALFQGYRDLVKEEAEKKAADAMLKQQIDACETEINELNAQKKNYNVALEGINRDLASIFGSRNRIQLYLDSKGNYRVKSGNRPVALKNVSMGERNAIALVYFLSLIKTNRRQSAPYSEPLFLVIDDPVSSFDSENKMGIYAFLRHAISEMLRGNPQTKIIVLTHDLLVLQSLDRLCSSIRLPPDGARLNIAKAYITPSHELKHMNKVSISQYAEWMHLAFMFANNDADSEFGMTVLNASRRVAEAYFTFNYGKGFDDAIHSSAVLDKIREKELKDFFENVAFRTALNAGSHAQDAVQFSDDGAFGYDFDLCTEDEKKQLVKNLICLLYQIDKSHVLNYLQKCNVTNAENTIEQWLDYIRKNIIGVQ